MVRMEMATNLRNFFWCFTEEGSGIAIKKNGNTVTILSGAIGLFGNIRGRIED